MTAMARRLLLAGLVLLWFGPLACTTVPVQELSDARQSIDAARSAGAALHAPGLLDEAVRMLQRATQELQAGANEAARRDALAANELARRARESVSGEAEPAQ